MRLSSGQLSVNNLHSPIKTNKVVVKKKIKFPHQTEPLEEALKERMADVMSVQEKLHSEELSPRQKFGKQRNSQRNLLANEISFS